MAKTPARNVRVPTRHHETPRTDDVAARRAYYRDRYARRQRQGLCARCPARAARRATLCTPCQLRQRAHWRVHNAKRARRRMLILGPLDVYAVLVALTPWEAPCTT